MDFSLPLFSAALPEIVILSMTMVVLMADVFLTDRDQNGLYLLVQFTLVAAFLVALGQYREYPTPVITFDGQYILDKLAVLSKLLIYLFSSFAFAYSREYIKDRKIRRGEYYILGLFSVLGMSIMVSAYSFLTIYLGLELLSFSLYVMVAMYKQSPQAIEAAMKYFVTGALASGMFLYGVSLLYGMTGEVQIASIAQVLQARFDVVGLAALIFILAALIFKFGAVPFHMWVPDVYEGAATPVTLFIASAPKVAAFAITVRVLVQALPGLQVAWQEILIVVSVLSMLFGNLLAIAQSNLKRMLAYSSIAHIGYTLLGVLAGPNSSGGYSAAMFYISTYTLVAAGAFAIIALLSKNGIEFDKLNDFRGLNARNPWIAFMMLLLMFSMAGVPPTVGFFAKLGLLESLVEAHYVWLAVLALLFALVGAYYYLRVVMLMYFEEPAEAYKDSHIVVSPNMMAAITVNGVAALVLGVLPSMFIDLCRISMG